MRHSLPRLALALAVISGVAALWIVPSYASQLSQPGIAPARFWINNRTREEAVPVSIANVDPKAPPVPVAVTGFATVDFTDRAIGTLNQIQGKTQPTTSVRQAWEYRVVAAAESDLQAALAGAGNEGWEAVGVTSQPGAKMTVLLKRPR